MNKQEEIIKRLDDYQNEYMEILFDILNHNTDKHKEGKEYIYWWERMKKLQQYIIIKEKDLIEQSLMCKG